MPKNNREGNQIGNIDKIIKEIITLVKKKNKDYGGSCFQLDAQKSFFLRIFDKTMRLKTLVWDGKRNEIDETVEDTIKDIIGYGLLWLCQKKKNNKSRRTKLRNIKQ